MDAALRDVKNGTETANDLINIEILKAGDDTITKTQWRAMEGKTVDRVPYSTTAIKISYQNRSQPICNKIWPNCAFYDTSMKCGTHLDFIITKNIWI